MINFLTIFSAPKPFTDPHIATIQRNAITSWTKLPATDVVLLGNDPGIAEIARELGVGHIKNVPHNQSGAPYMDAMFSQVREACPNQLYCIVNADVILLPNLVRAAEIVMEEKSKFVLLGQRWDIGITTPLNFSEGWESKLVDLVHAEGELHKPVGSDYFVFPESCYQDIPAFTIGRAGWDNWMIYQARKSGFPAIDGTKDVMAIHQNHDYSHLPNGQPHYGHPETIENIKLAGGRPVTRFTLLDTDYQLENGKILHAKMDNDRRWRKIESWPLLAFGSTSMSNTLWRLRKWLSQ